ncbi:MAG: glycosyltransferase [Chloroflexia bacterium]
MVLNPFLPYSNAPAGAPQAVYDRLSLLSLDNQVVLVTFVEQTEEHRVMPLRTMGIDVRYVVRHPCSKGLPLWRKRLRLAKALLLGKLPLLVVEFQSRKMAQLLRRTLDEVAPDMLLVEHRLMAQYLLDGRVAGTGVHPVKGRTIFSEHDARGEAGVVSGPRPLSTLFRRVEAGRWADFTREVWRSACVVLVPTQEDATVIRERAVGVPVEVVPYGLARPSLCEEDREAEREERNSKVLLFVGNFDHPPNRDAALRLGRTILPIVQRSIPSATLVIVGRNPTADIKDLASLGGVTVRGEVVSVEPYLRTCTIFVAPLRSGGGTRMKVIEAMMAGAPVVTTTLGAQGLEAEPGKHLLVADTDEEIADDVIAALGDPGLRARIASAARDLYCGAERKAERARLLNDVLQRYGT